MKPVIGITLGDPAGIGPEIVARALENLLDKMSSRILILGHPGLLPDRYRPLCHSKVDWDEEIRIGEESPASGRMAWSWLQESVQMARDGKIQGIVNGPVSKKAIAFHISGFVGQTGFYAEELGTEKPVLMSFWGKRMNLCLLTHHIPLNRVSDEIQKLPLVEMFRTGMEGFEALLGSSIQAVVAGVNPHAGEGGLLDCGTDREIARAVQTCQQQGYAIEGPLPGDTLFTPQALKRFNLIFAAHHDQGLAPFKAMHPFEGLGISIGLSVPRMTVDHGTAFELAGKGIASSQSMEDALWMMDQMLMRR